MTHIQPWVSEGHAHTFHIETEQSAELAGDRFQAICGATGDVNWIHTSTSGFAKCRECQRLASVPGGEKTSQPQPEGREGTGEGGGIPGAAPDSDPLQELLLYSDFMRSGSFFKPHTPETCDCGELVVRHCRCGKGVCQRHGYAIQDSLDLAKQTILCGE